MDIVTKASDSPLFFVVTAVFVLLLARLSLKLRSWRQRKKQNYPPVAATIFHQLTNLHRLHDFHTNLSQKYRTFRVLTPFCNYIYTVDLELLLVHQAGPRICLGKEFAYRQMKTFAATLLHFFKFKLSDEREVVNYRSMVTLQIDGGLHLCALHR